MSNTISLESVCLDVIHCWLWNDTKQIFKTSIYQGKEVKESFKGENSLFHHFKETKSIKTTKYNIGFVFKTQNLEEFFKIFPNETNKEDIFWKMNFRYSESCLVSIFMKYIEKLKTQGFTSFAYKGKEYLFSSFEVFYYYFVPKELDLINTTFGPNETIYTWMDTNIVHELCLKSNEMILDLAFGVHGFSKINSVFAFVPVQEYLELIPGNILKFEKDDNANRNIGIELKRNAQSINPCMKMLNIKSRHCRWCVIKYGSKLCGNCKETYYCSQDCQKKDWTRHKVICRECTKNQK